MCVTPRDCKVYVTYVAAVVEKSSEHISPQIFGEVTPTVGKGLDAEHEGYDGTRESSTEIYGGLPGLLQYALNRFH